MPPAPEINHSCNSIDSDSRSLLPIQSSMPPDPEIDEELSKNTDSDSTSLLPIQSSMPPVPEMDDELNDSSSMDNSDGMCTYGL